VTATSAVREVALACEISEDRRQAAIVVAGRSAADTAKVAVDLVFYDHPRDAVRKLDQLYADHGVVAVVVDGRSQSATLLGPLAEAGIAVTLPSSQDVVVAHLRFLDLVSDGELEHRNQEPLTAAVRASAHKPLAGAHAWDRRVLTDQAPLVAASLAVWAFTRWEEMSRPGAWAI
jgi:hypothetical protein